MRVHPSRDKRMKIILLACLVLSACRGGPSLAPTRTPAQLPAAPATLSPAVTSSGQTSPAPTPGLPVTAKASPTTPSEPGAALGPPPPPQVLPTAWDDRSVYQSGLISSAQGVLGQLPAASVYHIDMSISQDRTKLSGEEEVRYTNHASASLDRIYFRLFPNLLGGQMSVSNVMVNGAAAQASLGQQNSVLSVPLGASLPPGGQVVVRMRFEADVPPNGSTGYNTYVYAGEILSLAQFYPLIPAYDAQGWHIEIPPNYGDPTYTEASFFEVRLTAPADLTLAATGVPIDQTKQGDTQVVTYAAGPVRDFYLSASSRYVVSRATIGETIVSSYGFQEDLDPVANTLDFAQKAFASYGKRFGVYPYTHLNIVLSPTTALGVEYPQEIALAEPLYEPSANTFLESTAAHEIAHQWFYGLVGDDQVNQPWLDEAMAQYSTYLYYLDEGNQASAQATQEAWQSRLDRARNRNEPIGLPVASYDPNSYSAIVYGRGPIFLSTLAGQMGQDNFNTFLKDYFTTYEWKIATTADFEALAQKSCGCDLSGLFSEWIGK